MRKITYILLSIAVLLATSCLKDAVPSSLSTDQQALLGTAVQFDPFVDKYIQTKKADVVVYDGGFNTGDMMYIYRQYYENGQWIYKTPPGTIYKYTDITNGETGIFDKESWRVYEGKTFTFQDPSYNGGEPYSQLLEKKDSITWESGQSVRFRAWVLSRVSNDLSDKAGSPGVARSITYPDYMVCDWVMTSGPTQKIPMAMRHLGCRFSFVPLNSNQFRRIEIATDPEDYMRNDNADSNEDDEADKHPVTSDDPSVLTAAQCAANVEDVFSRMCWPGGVNIDDMSLTTCLKGQYVGNIEHGTLSEDEIKNTVRRAGFDGSSDSRFLMISIPYDMSNGPHKDEPLVIPPYTRFKVWMRDVNGGDISGNPVSGAENTYHIFSLSDVINKSTGASAFPDGITMLPGRSYQFSIGYYYNSVKVYAEDNFSWEEQDLGAVDSDDASAVVTENDYDWWINAVATASETARLGGGYNPDFRISTLSEMKAFAQLVNGTFTHEPELFKDEIDGETFWYKETITNGDGSVEPLYLDKNDLKAEGYVFYKKYTPSIADRPASVSEEYLQSPYSFYDPLLQSRLTVKLDADIDMEDLLLPSIGSSEAPFAGIFNGCGHTVSNLYVEGGTLFGYVNSSNVMNVSLKSTHPVSITGTCNNSRILGCSVYAPSTRATLANLTLGMCYFVGCIHVGASSNVPLVNDSRDKGFQMYGCMQAASGITGAALANVTTNTAFIEQIDEYADLEEVSWGFVSCNYYDTELSTTAKAFRVGGSLLPVGQRFHRLQYIRGAKTHVLCAKNDYLVDAKTEWKRVSNKDEYYGIAPWRAMNFGIYMYNSTVRDEHKCKMHYECSSPIGYYQQYPVLHTDEPAESQMENVLDQFN